MKNIIFLLLALFLLVSCGKNRIKKTPGLSLSKTGKVNFYEGDFGMLLDKAEQNNKLIFVDVYADWCLPCKQMDKFVFTDDKLARYLNDNFINYKINTEGSQGDMIQAVYSVQILPSILILDQFGEVITLKEGYVNAEVLLNECKNITRKNKLGILN